MHNQKTAGTSITISINQHLGRWDEQIGQWEDTLKYDGRFNLKAKLILIKSFPRIFASKVKYKLKSQDAGDNFKFKRINEENKRFYKKRGLNTPTHSSACDVKEFNKVAWQNYFKFVVVRNPWDRAISYYLWRLKRIGETTDNISFKEYLKRKKDPLRPDPEGMRGPAKEGWVLYTIDDRIAVDFVVRYENLQDDLNVVSKKIGIPIQLQSSAKTDIRDKKKKLADYYDAESVRLVEQIYHKEICEFGYEPPVLHRL